MVETDDNKKDSGVIYFDDFKVQFISTAIEEYEDSQAPLSFKLYQNFPNPFNPVTTIKYSIPHKSKVKIYIYDLAGRLVSSVVDNEHNAGVYQTTWNAGNYASGVYFYRLQTDNMIETQKMIVLK